MYLQSSPDSQFPVVIVGAGPTGLALALGLARCGVRTVVLEKEAATSRHSRAPGIHVRTLEVLQQWGVKDAFLEAGELRRRLHMRSARRGRTVLDLDFAELDDEAEHPGILLLEQAQTEALLLAAARATGLVEVHFSAEAIALRHGDAGAQVVVRERGSQRTFEAAFVVGCDGASSFVRTAARMPFEGITYSIQPLLADVRITDERDTLPWPRLRNGRHGLTAAARLRPELWRIIRLESSSPPGERVSDSEVALRVREVLGEGDHEVVWASRFRIHRRSSPRFRIGRILLAGDAAHIHSPVGGQGMNSGIQDAHNLAWKLAQALEGGDTRRLLDSYDVERRAAVVGTVSRYTDFLTRVFLQAPAAMRTAAFAAQRAALKVGPIRRKTLRRITMIDLDYPASPLLGEGAPAAGRRLPNPLLKAPDGSQVRLYDLLPPGPAILDVAKQRHLNVDLPLKEIIRIGADSYQDASGRISEMLDGQNGWILVRPDLHVAWARDRLGGMKRATARALGK